MLCGLLPCGMVLGMASVKVTITLGEAEIAQIRKLARDGKAPSVSGFVQHAVRVALADVAGWGAMLALALQQTGGPLSASERAWADSVLKPGKGRGRRRAA
jgi:Arc/MetJ-type ribon-helix-helix transcriptional regulator